MAQLDRALQAYQLTAVTYLHDGDQLAFARTRAQCMQLAASAHGPQFSLSNIAHQCAWDMLPVGPDGFYTSTRMPLTFPPGKALYTEVQGFTVNNDTGAVNLILQAAASPDTATFSNDDVQYIMRAGLHQALFSLDPISRTVALDPLQEATFAPTGVCTGKGCGCEVKCPEPLEPVRARVGDALFHTGNDILKTWLVTDRFLKTVSSGVEMSSAGPLYLQRATHVPGGLLQRLDPITRHKLRSLSARLQEQESQSAPSSDCRRTWLDCSDIPFTKSTSGNTTTYKLGPALMQVKIQVFVRDPAAPPQPSAPDFLLRCGMRELSPEVAALTPSAKLVADFNSCMSEVCNSYPEFARLLELFKLMSLSKLLMHHATTAGSAIAARIQAASGFCTSADDSIVQRSPPTATHHFHAIPSMLRPLDHMPATKTTGNRTAGDAVDVQDEFFSWYTAQVVKVVDDWVLIHYDGYSKDFDCWLPSSSDRIAPFNSHTASGRSMGPGSGKFVAPPIRTAVLMTAPGTASYSPGTIVSVPLTQDSFVARPNGGGPDVTVSATTPIGCVRFPYFDYTPTLAAIQGTIVSGGVRPGMVVDIRDEFFVWYTGVILDVNEAINMLFVSYDGWGSECWTWIPCSPLRVAPINTHTPAGQRSTKVALRGAGNATSLQIVHCKKQPPVPGTRVETAVSNAWQLGTVQETKEDPAAVLVRFDDSTIPAAVIPIGLHVREFNPMLFNPAPAEAVRLGQFQVGHSVDVRDMCFGWYTATVIEVDLNNSGSSVTIAYDGWPDLYRERISLPCPRIAVLHTHTKPGLRSAPGCVSPTVSPPVGSRVRVLMNPTAAPHLRQLQGGCIRHVTADRVAVQLDDGATRWLDMPIAYGTLQDEQPAHLLFDKLASCTFGGVKLLPVCRLVDSIPQEPPSSDGRLPRGAASWAPAALSQAAQVWGAHYQSRSDPGKMALFVSHATAFRDLNGPVAHAICAAAEAAGQAFHGDRIDRAGRKLDGEHLTQLLYKIAMHESEGGRFTVQQGSGIAQSYFQVEPATALSLVQHSHPLFGPKALAVLGFTLPELQRMTAKDMTQLVLADTRKAAIMAAAKLVASCQTAPNCIELAQQ